MKLVIVESPFAGDVDRNLAYVRACMRDCLRRGEAPYASHALYTQPGVLDDDAPAERRLGIDAGLGWGRLADVTVVYTDLGITPDMLEGIAEAEAQGRPVENRTLGTGWAGTAKYEARRVLGYAVATRRDGTDIDLDYSGPIEGTAAEAARYCTEEGDFIVAICEVEG